MKYSILLLSATVLFSSCGPRASHEKPLVSMQLLDRNGFSETINAKDRLKSLEQVDFLKPQPYQRVLRVFDNKEEKTTFSKITTYHSNGEPWQYLEVKNGRAYGHYREWYPNGHLCLESYVVEGIADINEKAQMSWIFDGKSSAWDEEGHLVAEIFYEKGSLQGTSLYYFKNKSLSKRVPYDKDLINGILTSYSENGNVIESISYKKGLPDGLCEGFWDSGSIQFKEVYKEGFLESGFYYDLLGTLMASIKSGDGKKALFENGHLKSLITFEKGSPLGEIKNFDKNGSLISLYHVKDGLKDGDEWEYFQDTNGKTLPKLKIEWKEDVIQGTVKTWYRTGSLETEKAMQDNKKQGLSLAFYRNGDLMLMEEYDNNSLIKGSYFKKGEKGPVTTIEHGKGTATLFDADGRLLQKITYDKGQPQLSAR